DRLGDVAPAAASAAPDRRDRRGGTLPLRRPRRRSSGSGGLGPSGLVPGQGRRGDDRHPAVARLGRNRHGPLGQPSFGARAAGSVACLPRAAPESAAAANPTKTPMLIQLSRLIAVLAIGAALPVTTHPDEGMWPFDGLPLKLLKEKYNFEPTKEWLDPVRLGSVRV